MLRMSREEGENSISPVSVLPQGEKRGTEGRGKEGSGSAKIRGVKLSKGDYYEKVARYHEPKCFKLYVNLVKT
ncbi:MAG: hypothetical protein WD512_05070 [Candidatus Paceibacterota bacterium]